MKTKTFVKVRWQVVGFHCWPDAPPHRRYLGRDHRHTFHFQVECAVDHLDRNVEFHDLLEAAIAELVDVYVPAGIHFGHHSCEMIAAALLEKLRVEVPGVNAVEVWEDEECGARVEVEGE